MRRLLALGAVALAGATVAAQAAHQSAAAVQTPALLKCSGIWRWPIKTLADKPKLTHHASSVNVADLWDRAPGQTLTIRTPRIEPFEATIYRVTAILKYARHVDDPADANGKGGGDLDYHLVIADINNPAKTMIVEFPDPGCTKGATTTRRKQMKAARLAFATDCHGAPQHDFANLSGRATITGVGFYDEPHAKGRSLHGAELHPVLSFSSTNCRWVH